MRVLIVDDSPILRERVAAMLSEFPRGIELIAEAGNACAAAEAIRRLRPDTVILDINMPGKSGIELLKEIKGDSQPLIVVILTNHPYPQYRQKCMEAGADFFFDKSTEFCKATRAIQKLTQDSRWDRGGDVCKDCPSRSITCSSPAL